MAIAEMEKLHLTFKTAHLDEVLHLMQGFQGIHIDTGFESTIPPDKKAKIDKEIRETEKILQEIQTAYNVLKGRESTNMLNFLKNSGEKKLSMPELNKLISGSDWGKILDDVIQTDRRLQNNRTRRQEVIKLLNNLKIWEHLEYNPLDFAKLQRTKAIFGSIHKKHAEEFSENLIQHEEDGIIFEIIAENETEDRVYFLLIYHNSMSDRINVLINEFSFSTEEYPFDKPQPDARKELETEEAWLIEEETEIGRLIADESKYDEILLFAEDYNLNILLRKKKSLEVTYDEENIIINGWILREKRGKFEKLLSKHIPAEDYQILISSVRDKDIDEVPIKLKNNKFVSVYERLTDLYSLPKYNEIDPTPVMTVFYLIFFGLMVADIGYGIAIFLIGLVTKKFLKLKRSTQGFIDFLFYLSFPIMGWGVVFGNICGIELPFALIRIPVDIMLMIILSIVLGFFHIMAGLVLQMLNQIKLKKYYEMIAGGLSWFLIFLGGGVMILTGMTGWFAGVLKDIIFYTGFGALAAGLAMVIIVPAIQYGKRWYAGIGKGLYSIYGATSYFGDFISYTRLMALGVAGGSIASAFNSILAFLPLPARFTLGIVLALVLHGLNIFLSMLSAYVHGMRLQFIEFFGKFYTGGGKRFEPFKAAEKNVIISETDNYDNLDNLDNDNYDEEA